MTDLKMEAKNNIFWKKNALLFIVGFVGVLSSLPLIPQLVALQPEKPPMPIYVIQLISVLQTSVLLLGMVLLGTAFSRRVNLKTPAIDAFLNSESFLKKIKPQIFPALIGGIVGGVFILVFSGLFLKYLPPEFLVSAGKFIPPWYTKILYGGITEEILVRWGLMSFFTWCFYRATQSKDSEISSYNYIAAICLSALLFGAGHLPVAFALSSVVTLPLVMYIIIANAAFGIIAGYLFWKRGLECAIVAHMVAHITMIIGTVFQSQQ